MASVRQKSSSRYWYACITLPNGKRQQFSTGLEDRGEALAAAHATERAMNQDGSAQRLRTSLERLADDFAQEDTQAPAEWLMTWLESRRLEVAPATWEKYKTTAEEAAAFLVANQVDRFSKFTTTLVKRLRNEWAENRAPSTANGKVKILRTMLADARREKLLEDNPAANVTNLRTDAVKRRNFTPAELQILIPTLSGEWRALFFLGLYTGQRLNDLVSLEWRQIDLQAKTITFIAAKTDSVVALPLLEPAVEALAELPSSDSPADPVFPVTRSKGRTTRSNQFRRILAAVGLARPVKAQGNAPGRREPAELSFHSLRHTASTMLKSAGVSDAIARAIIGHESPAISRNYTHFSLDTMRENMEKMPKL
jgi:integrase